MLVLKDRDLAGVDPFDPNLDAYMKARVIQECKNNVWYFLREVAKLECDDAHIVEFLNSMICDNPTTFLQGDSLDSNTKDAVNAFLTYLLYYNYNISIAVICPNKVEQAAAIKNVTDSLPRYFLNIMVNPNSAISFDSQLRFFETTDEEMRSANLLRGFTVDMLFMVNCKDLHCCQLIFKNGIIAVKKNKQGVKQYVVTSSEATCETESGKFVYDLMTPLMSVLYDVDSTNKGPVHL